ncbi:MAG: SDR family NAD(P)-dependent oxidoreductase, partial [Aquiluna sp.]
MAEHKPGQGLAIITGGAGDIGSAIAMELASDGWGLVLVDVRDQKFGDAKAEKISSATGAIVKYQIADQCDAEQMNALVASMPALSLMVITAATVKAQPFLEIELEQWKNQIDLNLTGSFIASQAAAKSMKTNGVKGHVIFISSWVASRPWPEITAYTASKAGVEQLMRQLALELAPDGIRANAIAPGIVKAGLAKHQLETEPAYAKRVASAIPLGELQEASDIGAAVRFMASSGASTMTGSVLTVDSGCTLGQVR